MGLLSAKGKVILPFEYDNIAGNNHYITPYLLLEKNGKRGQFNCKNAKLLPAVYDNLGEAFDTSGVLFVQQGGYFALFSAKYVQLTEFVFDHSDPVFFGPNLLCLRRGEKYVLTDRSGKQLPIGEMDEFRLLDNPNYAAFKKDHYYGCIRQDGKIILEPKFSGLSSLGRRAIQVDFPDGEAQIYNLEGGLISKESFNVVTLIDESHFLVEKGEFNAVLTFEGEYSIEIVPNFVPRLNFIRCDMGSCIVAENGKMGLFRADGTVILPMEYDLISGALDQTGYFMVRKGKMFGFINWEGEWLTGLAYDFARPFYSGLAPVCSNGKWGYIAENGKVVIPLKFDFAENFGYYAQEAIVAMAKSLWWIDKKGKIIREIPYSERISLDFQHSPIYCITETGLGDGLRYEGDDTWLLKPTGYQLQKIFYNLLVYSRPLMKGELLPPFGLMDYAGQHITDMVFDEFNLQHIRLCEMIPARKGTKWGFINTKGETVVPFIYDKVWNNSQPIQNGKWLGGVHSNGQSWTIDITGNKVKD